jgi:hypothetical protein
MMNELDQCVLRRGSHFISALWIRTEHSAPGTLLDVQYTHSVTGAMGSRAPSGKWVAGRWSEGWIVHERWGRRRFPGGGTNNKTRLSG